MLSNQSCLNDSLTDEIDRKIFAKAPPHEGRGSSDAALASAKDFVCRSHGSGGGIESGKRALVEWAQQNGRLVTSIPWRLGGSKDVGEGEHHVFFEEKGQRWVKITKGTGSSFGRGIQIRRGSLSLGSATACQYLERLLLQNEVLGDDARLHAVYQDKYGNVNIIMSQAHFRGNATSQSQIGSALGAADFVHLGASDYYRESDNLLLMDLHEGNAVLVDGALAIFDAIPLHPSAEQRAVVSQIIRQTGPL